MRILEKLFSSKALRGDPGGEEIERGLRGLAERSHRADPETGRQWQMLQTRMEALGSSAPLPIPVRTRGLLRPAVAILTVAAALFILNLFQNRVEPQHRYATARGERSTIVLPDSSEVVLNHTTEITVPEDRRVEGRSVGLAGEAFFRVKKSGRPFVVTTAAGRVEVLGTEFNVRIREDQLEVAVVSGTVQVSAADAQDSEKTVLRAGTCISFRKGEPLPRQGESLLFPEYPGWLHGKLLFQRRSLRSVCDEIEAMFDVTVTIASPTVGEEKVSGALDSRSAESALITLARVSGTHLRHDSHAFILY